MAADVPSAPAGADAGSKREGLKAGQIRSFRISKLDAEKKKIEVDVVS